MTDRLAELQQGQHVASTAYNVNEIEADPDHESDKILSSFEREANSIEKVYTWARKILTNASTSLDNDTSTAAMKNVGEKLDAVETKLGAVRKHLKRIAEENKSLAQSNTSATSSLRIRLTRYTKLGKDFMAITSEMETLRKRHKGELAADVKRQILEANPSASESHVDHAIDTGAPLDTVVQIENSEMRYQIEDLRTRNQDIQKLSKSIVELHQMFTDMSLLVEGQQELINNVEYNVKEVKESAKKGADELVIAHQHQKSARKKKMCIIILVILLILAITLAVVLPIIL